DRAEKGKVTFGDKTNRIGNQTAFASAINRGLAYSKAASPEVNNRFKARMNKVIKVDERDEARYKEQKNFVRNYAIRNAAIGMTLGGVGFAVMHHILENGGQQVAESAHDAVKVPYSPTPIHEGYETMPPDNTYVAMDKPPEDLGLHSDHDIKEFFPKSHEVEPVSIPDDAYIQKGEGIEHALRRQIEHNPDIAKELGWDGKGGDAGLHKFSGNAAHKLAIEEGYVDPKTGNEVRVKYSGDKDSFFKINKHTDGSLGIDEGHGTTYTENELTDKADGLSGYEREMNHPDTNEYIYKNGHKVGVINYPELEAPSPSIQDHTELMQGTSSADDIYTDENLAQETHNEVVEQTSKAQVGKRLVGNEAINTKTTKPWAAKHPYSGPYRTSAGPYRTTPGNGIYNSPGYNGNIGLRGGEIGPDGIMRTPQGYVMKEMETNGKTWYLDTRSTDPGHAFDGRVNRQYSKLIGDMFGKRDNLTGDIVIDKNMSNMLLKHMAEDDISAIPSGDATEEVKDYLQLVKQVHEKSGLEPAENIPTATYLKQALQKMKNDGINIRRFVNNILDEEDAENAALNPGSVPKVRSNQIVDDVYR
ncbi:MAG: hypothetical protein RL641_97, partial [Candidatus Parcubacteria bacterium]